MRWESGSCFKNFHLSGIQLNFLFFWRENKRGERGEYRVSRAVELFECITKNTTTIEQTLESPLAITISRRYSLSLSLSFSLPDNDSRYLNARRNIDCTAGYLGLTSPPPLPLPPALFQSRTFIQITSDDHRHASTKRSKYLCVTAIA